MNASAAARGYAHLTPEERFRLILAAAGRGDETEQARLANAGERITLSVPDDLPYGLAFDQLALRTFVELLAEAVCYTDAFAHAGCASERPTRQLARDLALAFGFTLRTKAGGWKLFCERLNVPPFLRWEKLPGFDRLRRGLALAEEAAFAPEDFLRWLNSIRPAGAPGLTEVPLTVAGVADTQAEAFRILVGRWGG
jgi:hypothetical protein